LDLRRKVTPARRLASHAFALVVLSFAFRLPALLNAQGTNSDASIVGLQARHILFGNDDLSLFLWGSHYQTSIDSCVTALFFVILGDNALALMLSSLVGHIALTLIAFVTLRRHVGDARGFVLCLALVFTSSPVHTYVLFPPRQMALTLAFIALAFLDRASSRARAPYALFAAGGAASLLAVFADPYALVFLPALAVFAAIAVHDGGARGRDAMPRFAAVVAGALAGAVPFAVLVTHPNASSGTRGMRLDAIAHNARILVNDALPWLLGAKVYRGSTVLDYAVWDAPLALRVLGSCGAAVGAILLVAGTLSVLRGGSWKARRLGTFSALVFVSTLLGFLGSVMVMDLFAARYLVAIALVFPFAVVSLARRLRASTLMAVMAPYLAATAVGGWVGYGPYVNGLIPMRAASATGKCESELRVALMARGIAFAIADYWTSYRLTFLFHELPIVVPLNPAEDRYRPYRDAFERADVFAYVFDPTRSREEFTASRDALAVTSSVAEEFESCATRIVVFRRVERGVHRSGVLEEP
jgi:hypothetical protein